MNLKRFWFTFAKNTPLPPGLTLGCGVTAFDKQDAIAIMDKYIFSASPRPEFTDIIEDVDVSSLDQNHVIPNMSSPHERGIWFPLGFYI